MIVVDEIKCPAGYECHKIGTGQWVTIEQLREIDSRMAFLENQNSILQLKKMRHFGTSVGCGAMVGPEVNSGQAGVTGTLGCGVLYGWRF